MSHPSLNHSLYLQENRSQAAVHYAKCSSFSLVPCQHARRLPILFCFSPFQRHGYHNRFVHSLYLLCVSQYGLDLSTSHWKTKFKLFNLQLHISCLISCDSCYCAQCGIQSVTRVEMHVRDMINNWQKQYVDH